MLALNLVCNKCCLQWNPVVAVNLFQKTRWSSTKSANDQIRSPTNIYQTLGLTADATQTEIREAFYRKAKQLHPDVNPSPEAKEEFEKVQKAFQVLKNPEKRSQVNVEWDLTQSSKQKHQDLEVFMTTKTKYGPRRIWSQKLEADLLAASKFRIARRKETTKKNMKMIKPHTYGQPENVRPITEEEANNLSFWERFTYQGPSPKEEWDYKVKFSAIATFTVLSIGLSLFSNYKVNERNKVHNKH